MMLNCELDVNLCMPPEAEIVNRRITLFRKLPDLVIFNYLGFSYDF